MEKKFYHYTHHKALQSILNDGYIRLADKSAYKNVKSIAWVSSNEQWENTATKMVKIDSYSTKSLTFKEQQEYLGCARIKIKEDGISTWAKLKHIAKYTYEQIKTLEDLGYEQKAIPEQWHGSLKPIQEGNFINIELHDGSQWVSYEDNKNLLIH